MAQVPRLPGPDRLLASGADRETHVDRPSKVLPKHLVASEDSLPRAIGPMARAKAKTAARGYGVAGAGSSSSSRSRATSAPLLGGWRWQRVTGLPSIRCTATGWTTRQRRPCSSRFVHWRPSDAGRVPATGRAGVNQHPPAPSQQVDPPEPTKLSLTTQRAPFQFLTIRPANGLPQSALSRSAGRSMCAIAVAAERSRSAMLGAVTVAVMAADTRPSVVGDGRVIASRLGDPCG